MLSEEYNEHNIAEKIIEMLGAAESDSQLRQLLDELHAADIVDIIEDCSDEEREQILRLLGAEQAADVLDLASDTKKDEILEEISDDKLAEIVDIMPPDDAADALDHIDDERVRKVLQRIDGELAEDIRELRDFEQETAGRIMTTEYFAVKPAFTVAELIAEAKKQTDDVETLHYILVVDDNDRLVGSLQMQDVLKADHNEKISNLMDRAVICIYAERDQEVAARMMEKYDLHILPVVGDRGKLLGIITVDDIMDILDEEAEEDMYRLAGIGSDDPFTESVFKRAWKRMPWLLTTMIGGAILAVILGHFQTTITEIAALVSFIPVIAGLGGNVGIQSSTITVRGLATGEIKGLSDAFWLIRREIAVGILIGVVVAGILVVGSDVLLNYCFRDIATGKGGVISGEMVTESGALNAEGLNSLMRFCLVLGGAVFMGIMAAATVGTLVPLVCHRLGIDPAIAAGPFVTVAIDVVTQSIYLSCATAYLLNS